MKSLAGRSLLVVDSEAACLGRWRQHLLAQGARVICSSSSDSALANAITFPTGTFHAAVIEHRPPRIDALELAATLRALPSMRILPLIVIAGPDGASPAPAGGAATATAVITRPVTAEQLTARLIAAFAPLSVPAQRSGTSQTRRKNYRGTVLVAEDDPVNAEIMHAMLASLGLDIVPATNGAEAIACAAQRPFDLVLMDAEMPVIDGLEATRRIRAQEASCGTRRAIVCVTANGIDDYRASCLSAGMDDIIAKPVGMAALLAVLARWLPAPAAHASGLREGAPGGTDLPHVAADVACVQPTSSPSANPPTSPSGPIDWSQVESLRSVDPGGANGIVGKAIGLYIDHAPKLIEEILTYRVTGDLKDVRQAAHSLRSSSASLGASAVAGLSATIESAAAKGDFEIIDSVVAALESEYRRAATELRKGAH